MPNNGTFSLDSDVDHHADEVAHCSRWHENRGFLPEEKGNLFLKLVDSGVIPIDIVAYLGFFHGLAHCGRRPSHGVTPEVDVGLRGLEGWTTIEADGGYRSLFELL